MLLALAVLAAVVRPRGVPVWAVAVAGAAVVVAAGSVRGSEALDDVGQLRDPLLFLLAAVPLSALLDRLGFFSAVAARFGHGRHLGLWCWVLAGAVSAVLNLDAAVVLLTPLFIRLARRHGLDPLALAFVPALQALLASSGLPVSNLTNLLVADRLDLGAGSFLVHLGLPTVAASTVGWLLLRRVLPLGEGPEAADESVDGRALAVGGLVVAAVLVGFTLGGAVGVPAWSVALTADLVLVAVVREVPWRSVPVGTGLLAAGLAVLAGAAVRGIDVGALLAGHGPLHQVGVFAASSGVAAVANNLPTVLVALPGLSAHPTAAWAVLLGVNIGPGLLVTGSLSGLLWLDACRAAGVEVSARTYSRIGALVCIPAGLLAVAVLVVLGS